MTWYRDSPMVLLNTHPVDTLDNGCRRILFDHKLSCSFQVCGFGLMEEIDVEPTNDLDEQSIDVLQCFIIGLQCLHELWRAIKEFFGKSN